MDGEPAAPVIPDHNIPTDKYMHLFLLLISNFSSRYFCIYMNIMKYGFSNSFIAQIQLFHIRP